MGNPETIAGLPHPKPSASPANEDSATRLPLLPGYEILGELGRGGMGVVYRARHTALKRTVALKMILSGAHAGQKELARFKAEAEAVARLHHPNIVQVYDVGTHDGKPFLSLEFCGGGSLERKLGGTPLPPRQAAALVEKLAQAVQAAHAADVVHRDLKPANVLLGADGTPKITDFGLAKKLDEQGATATGAVMGTPAYMAPEQAGGARDVGPPADIYALGAILYECLTGRPPFKGATAVDTIMQVVASEPVPPRQLQPTVPRDLDTICLKCLQKTPQKRYETAKALTDDLLRFQAGRPVRARPVGPVERAVRLIKRNPVVASLIAALMVALAAGVIVSSLFATQAMARARDAEHEAQAARKAEEDAEREARTARKAEDEAGRQAQEAQRKTRLAQVREYDATMLLVQNAWEQDQPSRFLKLLESQTPGPGQEDLRGFEWYYWKSMLRRGHRTFLGHTHEVTCVAYSPDGRRLASGSADGVKVWDVASGREAVSLSGDARNITATAFDRTGGRLAAASADKTVIVWDMATRQVVLSLKGFTRGVTSVTYSPDGNRLAAATADDRMKVWDFATGREVFTVTGGGKRVRYSPDGKWLAAHGGAVKLKLYEAATGREIRSVAGGSAFAFSPDSKHVAAEYYNQFGMVYIYDVASGQRVSRFEAHLDYIRDISYSADGKSLATASPDGTVKVWDPATGRLTATLKGHVSDVLGVAFSPDGKQLASAGADKTVKVWEKDGGRENLVLSGHEHWVTGVAFSPDGKRLASASGDKTLKLWDIGTGQAIRTFTGHTDQVFSLVYSPDGRFLASGSPDNTVRVWDAATGHELLTIKDANTSIAFSPDSKRLAVGTPAGVCLWDIAGRRRLSQVPGSEPGAFSRDWRRLAAPGTDGRVKVWEIDSGRVSAALETALQRMCFNPDGTRLAGVSPRNSEKTIEIWDVATGRQVLVLSGHRGLVWGVRYSPDGRRLATASVDGTVKLWNAQSGQEVLTLRGYPGGMYGVAFSPDGMRLATASLDAHVRVWDASTRR